MFPKPTLLNKKKISANFGPKSFGLKLEKSAKIFVSKLAEKFFIGQSGYGEQTLFYKKFSFIIEKILSVQWFPFRKQGFVIFPTGAVKKIFKISISNTTDLADYVDTTH